MASYKKKIITSVFTEKNNEILLTLNNKLKYDGLSLDEFKQLLDQSMVDLSPEMQQNGKFRVFVYQHFYADDLVFNFEIITSRSETDEELNKRIEQEKDVIKKAKKRQRERRYNDYLRLKKEFEK